MQAFVRHRTRLLFLLDTLAPGVHVYDRQVHCLEPPIEEVEMFDQLRRDMANYLS